MTKIIQYLISQTLWVMHKCSKGLHIGCLASPLEEVFVGKWFSFGSQNKLTLHWWKMVLPLVHKTNQCRFTNMHLDNYIG